jgi:hypothetical protein
VAFGAKSVAAFNDTALAAGKMRDSLGVTAEEASRLIEVSEDLGIGADTLEKSIGIMNRTATNTPGHFAAIGAELVKNADGTTNVNETFLATIDALNKIPDASQRAAAAQKVFGRGVDGDVRADRHGRRGCPQGARVRRGRQDHRRPRSRAARKYRDTIDELKGTVEELQIEIGGVARRVTDGRRRRLPHCRQGGAGLASPVAVAVTEALDFSAGIPVAKPWSKYYTDVKDKLDNVHYSTGTLGESITNLSDTASDDIADMADAYTENAAGMRRESQRLADKLTADWDRILGKINEEAEWRNAQALFGDLREAALTAWSEGAAGAEAYRLKQLEVNGELANYLRDLGDDPAREGVGDHRPHRQQPARRCRADAHRVDAPPVGAGQGVHVHPQQLGLPWRRHVGLRRHGRRSRDAARRGWHRQGASWRHVGQDRRGGPRRGGHPVVGAERPEGHGWRHDHQPHGQLPGRAHGGQADQAGSRRVLPFGWSTVTAWFDGVDISVEIAFASDPLAESPSWTDVTAYVRSIDVDAGRSSEYSEYSPGSMQVTLANNDRRFDPEYASSPYVGDLLPMKRIRVQATYSATTYPVFDGFILGWPQVVRGMTDETVQVSAVDGFRFLENAVLQRSAYEAAVLADSPIHYWPLQEQNTTASATYDDAIADIALCPLDVAGNPVAPVNTQVSSPVGADRLVGGVAVKYRSNDFASTQPLSLDVWLSGFTGTVVAATSNANRREIGFGVDADSGIITLRYVNETANHYAFPNTGIAIPDGPCHVAVIADATSLTMHVNGAISYTTSTFTSGTAPRVDDYGFDAQVESGGFSHLAVYGTTLTAARVAEHHLAGLTAWGHPYGERSGARIERVLDEIGWPDALRDLATGDTVHGPYLPARQSALDYLRQVAAGEDGLLFIGADGKVTFRDRSWQWKQATSGTFSDDGAGLPYSDIVIDANTVDAIRNQVAVSFRAGDGYVRVDDATSVTAYGPSSENIDADTVDSSAAARGLASYRLRTRKDPRLLVTELECLPRSSPSVMFPVVLGVELGDVVTAERTPAGVGSQIVKTLAVQGRQHSITPDNWVVRYYLAPAPTSGADAPYLLVNTSGSTSLIGAASGNLIPF